MSEQRWPRMELIPTHPDRAWLYLWAGPDRVCCDRLTAERCVAAEGMEELLRELAGFLLGWWPGLEMGLRWPDDADNPDDNETFVAAKKAKALLKRLDDARNA